MLLKAGVDISRLNREPRRSLRLVTVILAGFGGELIITSTYEGTHGEGSLHYSNDAYDIREPLKNSASAVMQLKASLGSDYDVVLESDHIHIEYDPN